MSLSGKRIVVGITGGIAAYKTIEFIRLLRKSNAEVRVALTPAAAEFVTPLTLQTALPEMACNVKGVTNSAAAGVKATRTSALDLRNKRINSMVL